ncbi:MAG TPA: ABC transporter ATP-binding protein [Bacillota bacterium]|nr:ABC transporter ATP-binding protein [Bacillota bacterium]
MKKSDKSEGMLGIFRSAYARSFIKKYAVSYIIGIIILVAIDYIQTEQPLIISAAIDAIKDGRFNAETVRGCLLQLAAIAASVFAGRIGWRLFVFGAARSIERDMRNDLYAKLQTLDQRFFQEHKAGEIMAYMSSDIETVRMVFAITVMMGLDTLTIGASTLYKMITRIDWRLSIAAFVPLTFVMLASALVGREMHSRYLRRQKAFDALSDFVQERLGGMKVVKAFVQEEKEWERFDEVNLDTRKRNISEARLQSFMWPFMRMVSGISMAVAIGYGGYIALRGDISVGQFSGFIMFLNMLLWPMAAIGRIINVLTRGSAAMQRLENILHTEPYIKDWPQARSEGIPEGRIEAKDLTFRYPGEERPVLKDISFSLEKGQTLGVVGRTGSGKTSLASLLMRIFDPPEGMLFIGGREIHEIPLKDLRRAIGCVPQDNFLFSDSIAANIAFGDRSKSRLEIENAARAACVHDNIMEFGDGYATLVGERGVSLSGGQKQRISIARALIMDPEILILDDAVSAVDTETEEQILKNLKELRAGKTNIIIAHRISALQHSDKIIVLEEGRIAESGKHDELLAIGGIYAGMYKRQLLEKMKREELAL